MDTQFNQSQPSSIQIKDMELLTLQPGTLRIIRRNGELAAYDDNRINVAIKKAFLESKVVEILSHLFTIINEEENTKISENLSSQDYLKIVAVENILKTQFKEKHTLASIAAQVGLNDFKLKKQFFMRNFST